MSVISDPCWETNGKWTPRFVTLGSGRPLLMHVLGGLHEDFRPAESIPRFCVTMAKPADISALVHAKLVIEPFDWWWMDGPDDLITVSFRADALHKWQYR